MVSLLGKRTHVRTNILADAMVHLNKLTKIAS